jgi:dUTPase
MHLYIYTADQELRNYLQVQIVNRRYTDSGFDIPMLNNQSGKRMKQMTFDFQMIVAATDDLGNPEPLLLVPRSSIANSPFRLANSIGLIDMGYRGSLKAKVDVID